MAHLFPVVVDLNVGGERMTTLLSTLTKDQDSMLAAMFSGRHEINKDKDGCYFIDCDGTLFKNILNYLRFGNLPPAEEALKVFDLATYFGIQSLVTAVEKYQSVQHRKRLAEMKSTFDTEKYEALKLDIINEFYKSDIDPKQNKCVHITSNDGGQRHDYSSCHNRYFLPMPLDNTHPCIRNSNISHIGDICTIDVRNDYGLSREVTMCLAHDLCELGFGNVPSYYCLDGVCYTIFLLNENFLNGISYGYFHIVP